MTQPAPRYQPYQPLPPMMGIAAPPKPSGGGLTSLIAGILALVTAALALGGSFAPITTYHDTFADGDFSGTEVNSDLSWWGVSGVARVAPFDEGGKLFGLSLVLVATVLVLGAAFAFVASRTRAAGPTTGGRSLITAGVGVLAGVVVLQSLLVLEEASGYNDRELQPGESLDFTPGLGLVLPLCALAIGVVAVVLAHVGQRPRDPRIEPNTPRMGFPAPYGYQQGVPATAGGHAGMPALGSPAVGAAAAAGATGAERPTDVNLGSADEWAEAADDDGSSEITQVVPGATASGTEPAEAPETAPAPITPATTGSPESPAPSPTTAPEAESAEPPAAAPETATQPASSTAESASPPADAPERPASPAISPASPSSAAESASTSTEFPAVSEETASPSPAVPEPAATESPASQAESPAVPTTPEPAVSRHPVSAGSEASAAKSSGLSGLPAAPPPPEIKED